MSLDFSYLHSLVAYLHQHPHIGGLITFLIAFAESLAIIGAIVPGSVTMTAIGTLIGSGVMPLTATLIWAISGAFAGDLFSFWVGSHYNSGLRKLWVFRKYPHWLVRGQEFFEKHGGKSVVFGRFVGPMRSAVPLIAGLMHMTPGRFILAALPSAALWSLVYICPGIIVGMLSLQLAPAAATKFILGILVFVAFSWLVFLGIHLFFVKIATWTNKLIQHTWEYFESHVTLSWITVLLSPTQNGKPKQNPHYQLTLLLFFLLALSLSGWIFFSTLMHTSISNLNEPLFELCRSLRTHIGDNIFVVATLLGDKYTMLIFAGIILLYLVAKRYFWSALHWFGAIILAVGAGEALKKIYYFPRPNGLLHPQVTSSFPSGHTILTVTFLGFLAVLITQHLHAGKRKIVYWVAGLLMTYVAISRLYLGAHWLTDVLASIFLGIGWILLLSLSYYRKTFRAPSAKSLSWVSALVLLCVWTGNVALHFRSTIDDYTLYWPKVSFDTSMWWNQNPQAIPLFVVSRLGTPRQVLNIQWVASIENIRTRMLQNGWEDHTNLLKLENTIHRISSKSSPQHLPLWPVLYQNQAPIALFTKLDAQGRQMNLMLWHSNVTLENTNAPLWLGSLYFYIPRAHQTEPLQPEEAYTQILPFLTAILKPHTYKIVDVSLDMQPPIMQSLNWNGQLLLINQ